MQHITTWEGFLQVSKTSNDILGEDGDGNDMLKMQGGSFSVKEEYEDERRPGARVETVHTMEAARDCQLEFFKRMPTHCRNCGANNPAIKK